MPHTIIDYNIELHNCFGSETVSNLCLSLIFFFACDEWLQVELTLFQLLLVDFIKIIWNLQKIAKHFLMKFDLYFFWPKTMWKFVFITGLWLLPRWLCSHNPAYCVHVVSVSAQSFNMWSFLVAKTKQRTVSSLLLETMVVWFVQSLGLFPSCE